MLKTHKQDEWDRFLIALDLQDGSIYKLNKKLLHNPTVSHPLTSQSGPAYLAYNRAELFVDTFERQFAINIRPDIAEVNASLRTINNPIITNSYFTIPGTVKHISIPFSSW